MAMNPNADGATGVFGGEDTLQFETSVRRRWGATQAYRESDRRTSNYNKEDWERHGEESEVIELDFLALMRAGLPADGVGAKACAERHRELIERWFYPCSYDMHTGLAEMYVGDPGFAQHYDNRAAGLAQYVHDAIMANAGDHL